MMRSGRAPTVTLYGAASAMPSTTISAPSKAGVASTIITELGSCARAQRTYRTTKSETNTAAVARIMNSTTAREGASVGTAGGGAGGDWNVSAGLADMWSPF